jgi:imidazolonepropionase-like amidohydrolase
MAAIAIGSNSTCNSLMKLKFKLFLLALAVGSVALWFATQTPTLVTRANGPAPDVLIRGVQIAHVETGSISAASDVLLSNGRITSIVPHEGAAAPAGTQVIEGKGLTLIPGLIDSHCHVASPPEALWDRSLPNTDLNLQRLLYSGVTRVFDPGAMSPDIFELREELNSGARLGPKLYAAGPIFTAKGGHPAPMIHESLPGFAADYLLSAMTRQIGSVAEAEPAVEGLLPFKPDFIKLAIDQIPEDTPRLNPELARAVVQAANGHNLRAVAHIGRYQDAVDAAEAGVSAWIHGVYKERLSDEGVLRLRDFNLPMVPTLVVFKTYAEIGRGEFEATALELEVAPNSLLQARITKPEDYEVSDTTRAFVEMLSQQRKDSLENVGRLHEAGVRIIAGSDAQSGVLHGPALHRELDLLSQAGLSNLEVLRAATLYAAQFLQDSPSPTYGMVQAGKEADLVLLRGNPLQGIGALHEIEWVILGGKVLDRHPLQP